MAEQIDHQVIAAIEFWQPYSNRPLSREDARQIIENITGFFNLVEVWDMAERRDAKSQTQAQVENKPGRKEGAYDS